MTLLIGGISKSDNYIAMVFDVIKNHSIQMNNNITDNWLENNTVVNDAIAVSPVVITLSGLSSEIVFKNEDVKILQKLYDGVDKLGDKFANKYVSPNKLTALAALYPPVDNVTQTAKNIINSVSDNVERYVKIFKDIFGEKKDIEKTRLQSICDDLEAARVNRTEFTAQTPFGTFEQMYIQSVSLNQENINHTADISITLKRLNFSDVNTTAPDAKVLEVYNYTAKMQNDDNALNLGKVQGFKSLLKLGTGAFGKVLGF